MRLPYIVITCARIDSIKCVCSEPPCCSGAFLDLLSIHDNFGDEDGILGLFYCGQSERNSQTRSTRRLEMPTETDAAQTPVRNIRKVQKFAVGTDFEAYAEQLEFFFVANGVTDSKQKKAALLTNLPSETYQLAKDLVAPILLREDSLTYDTIIECLQKQLKPQKSALVAWYEFDNLAKCRRNGESVCCCFKASSH